MNVNEPCNHQEPVSPVDLVAKLVGHLPDKIHAELPFIIKKYQIDTPTRLAHFLGQCSHESLGFTRLVENLKYSAERLAVVWPNRFAENPKAAIKKPNQLAKRIAGNPEAIGNNVYGGRMGNGVAGTGDGYKYRGRSAIQLTGKENYTAFSKSVGDPKVITDPSVVSTKYALTAAGWYWDSRNLNDIIDFLGKPKPKEEDKPQEFYTHEDIARLLTKKIQGGTLHIQERLEEFQRFYKILT